MWQAIVANLRYLRDSGKIRAALASVLLPYLAIRLKMSDTSAVQPLADAISGVLIGLLIPTGTQQPTKPQ